jgi:hypothetical protein
VYHAKVSPAQGSSAKHPDGPEQQGTVDQFQQDQTASYGKQLMMMVVVAMMMIMMMIMTRLMSAATAATLSCTSDYSRQLMSATDMMQAKLSERQVQRSSRGKRKAFT